jgi:hypothetical protein
MIMVVHKIQIYYSVSGVDEFHQWLETWHESVSTQTSDFITNEIPESTTTKPDVTDEWYSATFTYNSSEDITELQPLYDKLIECCAWSKAVYHSCPDVHENAYRGDCSIKESNVYRDGDIPSYIETLVTE